MPAITAWRVNGLGRPDAITAATDAYLGAQDILGRRLAKTCDTSPNGLETAANLYAAWCVYAKAIGETPGTQRRFAARLERHGLRRERMCHTRFYRGVRLLRSGELQEELREVRGRLAWGCEGAWRRRAQKRPVVSLFKAFQPPPPVIATLT